MKSCGYIKNSQYVPGFDGTKLAVDIVRPTDENGVVVNKRLPVILVASRGDRWLESFTVEKEFIARGYIYAVAEMRGAGASFGYNDSFASIENRKDVASVIEWITKQTWSDGNVGMMGGSNRGLIQFATATVAPKGLKSIMPVVSNIDFYYQDYPNGVSAIPSRMLSGNVSPVKKSKSEFLEKIVPVDDDPNGDMAYEAYEKEQFPKNKNFMGNLILPNMYRDSANPNFKGEKTNITIPPVTDTEAFKKSGINVYQMVGWFDSNTLGQIIAQRQWGGLLTIGPWTHGESCQWGTKSKSFNNPNIDFAEEYGRWFDYTLKNQNNGMLKKASVTLLYKKCTAGTGMEIF